MRKPFVDFLAQQDTLEKKLFWLIFASAGLLTLISALMTLLSDMSLPAIACRWACVYAFGEIAVIAHRSQRHRDCYMAMCLIFNCVLLPLNFFCGGGIHSGMPIYFVAGIFLCSFCMTLRQKIITFFMSIMVMISSIFISMTHPQWVSFMPPFASYLNIAASLLVISCAINMVCALVMREHSKQRYKDINNGIIDVLSTVVESRSVESGDHVMRIKGYTKILLQYVNQIYGTDLKPDEMEVIYSASAMHDVGKIAIPDNILLKPGRFTKEEYEIMKKHTVLGCDIIETMEDIQDKRYYDYSYEICRYHHERYDGSGYPEGLKGDEIPLAAQIVSLADVYDALVNERVYKKAFSHEEAYRMITNGECGQFSPKLMQCFDLARLQMEEFASTPFVNPLGKRGTTKRALSNVG